MRALFVLHEVRFVYGASRSIMELLQNLDYDFDILICDCFTIKIDKNEMRSLFGAHLKEIYVCWLPRYRCFPFNKTGMIAEISHYVNYVMAFLFSHKRKRIIKQGNYDYVHLNSTVLFPMIDEKACYVMHVRELLKPVGFNKKYLVQKLKKARGLICIDEATKTALGKIIPENEAIVLNNPFNMKGLNELGYEEILGKYGLSSEHTIFAMLGRVEECKGSGFVIRSFMKQRNENSRLLIVGDASHGYGKECKCMAEQDPRIIFCGELKDVREIYRISDYIIRGEEQFCIGRTVFEGLYAGTGVILPGCKEDLQSFPESSEFADKIYFYAPGCGEELSHVVEKRVKISQTNREFRSNNKEYIKKYKQYIYKILEMQNRKE